MAVALHTTVAGEGANSESTRLVSYGEGVVLYCPYFVYYRILVQKLMTCIDRGATLEG